LKFGLQTKQISTFFTSDPQIQFDCTVPRSLLLLVFYFKFTLTHPTIFTCMQNTVYYHIEDGAFKLFKCTFLGFNV